MRALAALFNRAVGLFMDDARLALAVLGWLAFIKIALVALARQPGTVSAWIGWLLFAGLAVILLRSAVHAVKPVRAASLADDAAPAAQTAAASTGGAGDREGADVVGNGPRSAPAALAAAARGDQADATNQSRPLALRLDAASFPHPVGQLRRRETAISWVLLTGEHVYKIKKPVHFDFLDASTLERRRVLCEEELRLNRRFAPDLYEAVVPIGERQGHPQVGFAGTPVEYAVRMRQFDGAQELTARLDGGSVNAADMAAFGARLADWHAAAPIARDLPYGDVKLVRSQVLENFSTLHPHLPDADAQRLQHLEETTQTQLSRLEPLLRERRAAGQVRECHGDLHAGNVVHWQGRWQAFDCLEFEPRLRWIDVFSDVSFLFMDLVSHDRADLAHAFVSGYCERGGDYQGLRLLRFYAIYRALVRAKVDALAGATGASDARGRLHKRLATAECLARARSPALLLMHGVSGSGKSWLSGQLIGALGALRVRSDLERHRLMGPGAYSTAANEATYERLQACARSALQGGMRVIVDAAFLQRTQRLGFRQLARECACPLLLLACHAPEPLLRQRVAQRSRTGQDPSEATAEVLAAQLAARQPFDDEERPYLLEVDTSVPQALERTVSKLQARLSPADPTPADAAG
jgi:hypothetical protein